MHSASVGVLALCAIIDIASQAQAQQPAGTPVVTSQAEVRLEPQDGKTHYLLGDIIRLSLNFVDPAFPDRRAELERQQPWRALPGQKTVNDTDYKDLADDVNISPATGWFKWQGKSGHDYGDSQPVDATGEKVSLVLNQGYVFREPGHYDISVTTSRMSRDPVTTNTVGIDIALRSADEEAALVRSLDAEIAGGKSKSRKAAAEQLSYLTGDAAARAKVKWMLGHSQTVSSIMAGGLAATANQPLQLELLKAAWADPARSLDGSLQWALKRAESFSRSKAEPGFVMWGAAEKQDDTTRELATEYHDDLERAIASLPQRSGDVRRDTAYFLMQDNELSANQLARVKPLVLEEFPRMDPMAQSMLIETRWPALKDPALASALKEMVDHPKQWSDAPVAVERLVEVDPSEARPYVIKIICDPRRGLLLDKLNGVREDRVPEVDACLGPLLAADNKAGRPNDFDWQQRAQFAARFATPAILPAVREGWKEPTQDPYVFALLLRDAPEEAVALAAKQQKPNGMFFYPANKVYTALGPGAKFPPEILKWLRAQASGGSAAATAMYELAIFGGAEDRAYLDDRLRALRRQWSGREPEISDAQVNTPAYLAKAEEQELVGALLHAKAWKLTESEAKTLTDGCLSEWCRAFAPKPERSAQ